MAAIFNPWQNPVETGSLSGEFATPEFYDADEAMPELPMEQPSDQLSAAMSVIQQQSTVIQQLTEALASR
jgi:hypothetical protein